MQQVLISTIHPLKPLLITINSETTVGDMEKMVAATYPGLATGYLTRCSKLLHGATELNRMVEDAFPLCLDWYIPTVGGKGYFLVRCIYLKP